MKPRLSLIKQSFALIALQFVLLLGLFICRYIIHPKEIELTILGEVKRSILGGMSIGESGWGYFCRLIKSDYAMPLESVVNVLVVNFPLLSIILIAFFVLLNAMMITRTLSSNLVTPTRNYLPAIIYLIVSCGIFFPGASLAAMLASTLILSASVLFISSYARRKSIDQTFQAGVVIGLACLLYVPSIIFSALVPIAIWIFRRNIKEALVSILGLILPTAVMGYIIWAVGGEFLEIYVRIWELLSDPVYMFEQLIPMSTIEITAIVIIGVLLIISFITFVGTSSDLRTSAHKVHSFIIWFLLFALIGLFLPSGSPAGMPLIAIPLSILITLYFSENSGKVPLTLYVTTVFFILLLNILPFI